MKLEIEIKDEVFENLINRFQKDNFEFFGEVKVITPGKVVELLKKAIETDLNTISWAKISTLEETDLYNMIVDDLLALPNDESESERLRLEKYGDDDEEDDGEEYEPEYKKDYHSYIADSPSYN